MSVITGLQQMFSAPQTTASAFAEPLAASHAAASECERSEAPSTFAKLAPGPAAAAPPDGPRLNLGCGTDLRDGWVNIDLHAVHHPDLVADITDLRPLHDNYAGYALAQDILEHVPRDCCSTALREWNRVLKPGGWLELRVPDVIALARLLQEPERQTPEAQDVLLQCLFGTQHYNGDFHYNGFTEISLAHALAEAGFEVVSLDHHDEWLFQAIARKTEHRPPEALLRIEGDDAFVDAAYLAILRRAADPGGRAYYLDQLASGIPREAILASLRSAKE
jgi:predicted SAM-dependent methyltransferase